MPTGIARNGQGGSAPSEIVVQSILYNTSVQALEQTLRSLARAADLAVESGVVERVVMSYGDCSPVPVLSDGVLEKWRAQNRELAGIFYSFFDANLGSARGHNRLVNLASEHSDPVSQKTGRARLLLIMNPDVVLMPDCLINMVRTIGLPRVGIVEGRQIPIEHPKDYDVIRGDTSWASTACALIHQEVFDALAGFDADTFFLYCDDVDFSWRVRLGGWRVVHDPSAVVFHDKRLSEKGGWLSSGAERYYSAEAALLLAHKWSRPDLVERYLADFRASNQEHFKKASAEFERRRETNTLPAPLDSKHVIGMFTDGYYAPHRYKL